VVWVMLREELLDRSRWGGSMERKKSPQPSEEMGGAAAGKKNPLEMVYLLG
jgi:hypothetical protein